MDGMRLRASVAFSGITVLSAYAMQLFLGLYYGKDLGAIAWGLRSFSVIVVVLVVAANLFLWRALAPLARVLGAIAEGREPGPDERRAAAGSGARAVATMLLTIVFAFIVGPVAGMTANSLLGIRSYGLVDVVLMLLINVSIGGMAGTHAVLVLENVVRRPLEALGVTRLGAGERYASLGRRVVMAAVASLVLASALGLAAGYGYLRAAAEGRLATPWAPRFFAEACGLALFVLGWGAALSATVASGMARRLRSIGSRLEELAERGGDLTVRTAIARNDDIGRLSSGFNGFLEELHGLVSATKGMVKAAQASADALASSSLKAGEGVTLLEKAQEEVKEAAEGQRRAVEAAGLRIRAIAEAIESVADGMEAQGGCVDDSSKAVARLAQTVARVSGVATEADGLAGRLKGLTVEGDATLSQSLASLRELDESSRAVGAIVNSISKIAAQTNLLAMNAAIEAAHAGESGKGFAVVADEVRTLAGSSAENARRIADLVKDMTSRVATGVALAGKAGDAFGRLREGVERTTGLVADIAEAMGEQKQGAEELLAVVDRLQSSSRSIRERTAGQRGDSQEMKAAIESIVLATKRIGVALETEAGGLGLVAHMVSAVTGEAERNRSSTGTLAVAVSRFKTED